MERRWSLLQRTLRRLRAGEPVIVVSGLPRSGTSMVMQMLAAGGVEILTDRQRVADEDNPRGYFEDERIKNLHESSDRSWLAAAGGKAVKVISYQLQHLPRELSYRVVFVARDLDEVIASQDRMLERRAEPVPSDRARTRQVLERHLRKVGFFLAGARHMEVLELIHRETLEQPRQQAERITVFLRRRLDVEAMAGAVEGRLYRNRARDAEAR